MGRYEPSPPSTIELHAPLPPPAILTRVHIHFLPHDRENGFFCENSHGASGEWRWTNERWTDGNVKNNEKLIFFRFHEKFNFNFEAFDI